MSLMCACIARPRSDRLDAHAEELPHLLSLPAHHYDTARVIYRVVDVEGFVSYRNNRYSVPWNGIGQLFPLRITEDQLLVYNRQIELIATHRLLPSSQSGQEQVDPSHRAPRNQQIQLELLQQRFAEFGEHGSRFLEGLLGKQRCGKHQAQRVLVLCRSYWRADVVAALERAVRFHAYSYASLERILSAWGTPRPPWQSCTEEQQKFFEDWDDVAAVGPRPSSDYQHLLLDEESANDSEEDLHEPEDGQGGNEPENGARQDNEPEDRETKTMNPKTANRTTTNRETAKGKPTKTMHESPLREQIFEHLAVLRIPMSDEQFDAMITSAEKEQVSHLEFLMRFLSLPANQRRERSIERRIKEAGFPTAATLESFDWEFNRETIPRLPFEQLATGDFLERRDNVAFVGKSGTGKSHLIQSVGRACCALGYRVRYTTSAALLEDLSAAAGDNTLPQRIRYYGRFDFLIIDELGFEKLELRHYPEAPSLLYKIVDHRSPQKSTALVSNIEFKQWTDYLGDPPLTMALIDRIVDAAIIQPFEGKSYRMYRAEQQKRRQQQEAAAGSRKKTR